MKYKFITFEGIEGCGKSTQIAMLRKYLVSKKISVVLTREPGGCPISDQIRGILLDKKNKEMTKLTELFLYEASRNQHVRDVIKPNLKKGVVVLCDRYYDATTVYQGVARNIAPNVIASLNHLASEGLEPHMTFILDCPVEMGLNRARDRNKINKTGEERFEEEKLPFHRKVQRGYLKLAKSNPKRFKIINASQNIQDIHRDILTYLKD